MYMFLSFSSVFFLPFLHQCCLHFKTYGPGVQCMKWWWFIVYGLMFPYRLDISPQKLYSNNTRPSAVHWVYCSHHLYKYCTILCSHIYMAIQSKTWLKNDWYFHLWLSSLLLIRKLLCVPNGPFYLFELCTILGIGRLTQPCYRC